MSSSAEPGRSADPTSLDPTCATSWSEFNDQLRQLYNCMGSPSYRAVAARSKKSGHAISVGTAQNLAVGATKPVRRSVIGFLHGCGLQPPSAHAAWVDTWDRLNNEHNADDAATTSQAGAEVDAMLTGIETALVQAASRAVRRVGARTFEAKRAADQRKPTGPLLTDANADRLIAKLTPAELERLINYLQSPDFGQVSMQLVYLWSSSAGRAGLAAAVREELRQGLRHFVVLPPEQLSGITDVVLTALHEAGSRAGHRLVGEQVEAAVVAHVAAMAAGNGRLLARVDQLAGFHDVARRMRAYVAALHGEIRLPHTGVNRSVPWVQLYVPPTLRAEREQDPDPNPEQFIWPTQCTVILGDPGAGKSTFATKLAYDIATSTDQNRAHLVPFLVILRDLSAALERGERSLADHLAAVCRDPYHVDASADAIEYLLLNGRAVVILDGLDELTEIALRARVVRLVEGFVAAYPLVPVVVTSRRIGYLDAPLPQKLFRTSLIASFDQSQVEFYAARWFALDEGTPVGARERLSTAFLQESSSIEELRSNPLLLSLLCAMYSAEHFLPRNRAQIYERCALMVFERWDSMRGVQMPLQFQGHVRGAVQRLAWHLLTRQAGSELPSGKVVRLLVDFLTSKGYDEDEAERMAGEFLVFCAGRAWVLAEVGATGTEPIYGFAHRTFLEYFAAEHLVRQHPLPDQVWTVLQPRVGLASWEVIGQLALQMLDRNLEDGADRLLTVMLGALPEANSELRAAVTAFVSRALGHVTPSPTVMAQIIDAVVDQALALPMAKRIMRWTDRGAMAEMEAADGPLHTALWRSLDANLRYLRRALTARLGAEAAADNDVALLLTGQLSRAVPSDYCSRGALWDEVSAEIQQVQPETFARWRERFPWPRMRDYASDPSCVTTVCDQFGPAPFYQSDLGMNTAGYPIAMELLGVGASEGNPLDLSGGPKFPAAHLLRDALLRCPTPWLARSDGSPEPDEYALWSVDRIRFAPWPDRGSDLATFIVLYLPYLETHTLDEPNLGLVPPGRELAVALHTARLWVAKAAALAAAAKAAALGAAAKADESERAVARAAAAKTEEDAWAAEEQAYVAGLEAEAAVELAALPAQSADFLLRWARYDISVEEASEALPS